MTTEVKGLRFFNFDLHTHTPASKCYKYPAHTPEEIIETAIQKNLDGIAITDHNTAEWIDKMQEAAEQSAEELTIFPGVEVSMSDCHIVILFDPSKDQKHVENFLGRIDITADMYGKQDTICEVGIKKVITDAHAVGGLVILAHIDTHKGIYYENLKDDDSGVNLRAIKVINDLPYDAVEFTKEDFPWQEDSPRFDRYPAHYRASDNPDPETPIKHSKEGLGKHSTWFRMESPSLEGLRQCFTDPETRIVQSENYEVQSYPYISNFSVGTGGGRPRGYFKYKDINFHQGLNSIIGGRGVGKSTLIEFIRYALDQPPTDANLRREHDNKIRKLLQGDNPLWVTYATESGQKYRVERAFIGDQDDDSADVYKDSTLECINEATGERYEGDIASLLPILAYSQTEVVSIARHSDLQLRLIDQFIDTTGYEHDIQELKQSLGENDKAYITALKAQDTLEELQQEIKTLEEQLSEITNLLSSDVFAQMQLVEQKKQYIEILVEQSQQYLTIAEQALQDSQEITVKELDDALENDEDIEKALQFLQNLKENFKSSIEKLISDTNYSIQKIENLLTEWMPEFRAVESEYQNLLSEQGDDQELLDKRRSRIEQRLHPMRKRENEQQELAQSLEDILATRKELLDSIDTVYQNLSNLRLSKFDDITSKSEGKLRLSLKEQPDNSKYKAKLIDLLKGGAHSISTDYREKVADSITPRNLVEYVLNEDVDSIVEATGLSELWAKRIVERLRNFEQFSEFLSMQYDSHPEDVPRIEFRRSNDEYAPLDELSIGQKSTALVIIALNEGKMPILIDQPEDALDIISIWEDVAQPIRRNKNDRQFILTTHNSTVAVGADSDQFIVFEGQADFNKIKEQGSIDGQKVRVQVIRHLEGGEEPYVLKQKKYDISK